MGWKKKAIIGLTLGAAIGFGLTQCTDIFDPKPDTKYYDDVQTEDQSKIDSYQFKESGFNIVGTIPFFLYNLEGTTYKMVVNQRDYLYHKAKNKKFLLAEDTIMDNYLQYIANKVTPENKYMAYLRDEVIYKIVPEKENKAKIAQTILDLVHRISYEEDYNEHAKHPLVTLIEGGDCEDLSLLYASIARACDIDVILLHLEGHMAVGVNVPIKEGTYVEFNDNRYYIAETTGTKFPSQPAKYKLGETGTDKFKGELILGIIDPDTKRFELNEEEPEPKKEYPPSKAFFQPWFGEEPEKKSDPKPRLTEEDPDYFRKMPWMLDNKDTRHLIP